jgi:hypothetical protein
MILFCSKKENNWVIIEAKHSKEKKESQRQFTKN